MSKNTAIALANYFNQFVQSQIREVRFKNISALIQAGLRLLEEENKVIGSLPSRRQVLTYF